MVEVTSVLAAMIRLVFTLFCSQPGRQSFRVSARFSFTAKRRKAFATVAPQECVFSTETKIRTNAPFGGAGKKKGNFINN
jgi:hypothetical protein